jgi:hypothetical protein
MWILFSRIKPTVYVSFSDRPPVSLAGKAGQSFQRTSDQNRQDRPCGRYCERCTVSIDNSDPGKRIRMYQRKISNVNVWLFEAQTEYAKQTPEIWNISTRIIWNYIWVSAVKAFIRLRIYTDNIQMGIANRSIKIKRSKSIEKSFRWIRDRVDSGDSQITLLNHSHDNAISSFDGELSNGLKTRSNLIFPERVC